MKLHELQPAPGSNTPKKRIGRGQGSGKGGTSTKGHKGAQSRNGYAAKPGFEGGQNPLKRRLPKYGFTNPFRVEYKVVNLEQLQIMATEKGITEFTPQTFVENGVMSSTNYRIKVLARGELTVKVNITANKISGSAKAVIENLGGTVTLIPEKIGLPNPRTKPYADGRPLDSSK